MKLWNFIKENMLKNPGQGISENEKSLSFEEALLRAEEFAGELRGTACCAVLCASEMSAAVALLACFAAGVTALPLSAAYGEAHWGKIVDSVSPDGIVTDDDGRLALNKRQGSRYAAPKVHPALIMCTSGTSGKPKGAMLSEHNIITNVSDIAAYFAMGREDTVLIARPLYHCAVLVGEFLTALVKGAGVRFCSGPFNPAGVLERIRTYGISVFCATPTLLSLMVRFSRGRAAGSLRHIGISGECMDAGTGRKIRAAFPACSIYHVYGLTEACPRVSYLPPEYFDAYPDCVGIPLKSVSVKILNRAGEKCRENEEGILYVKGGNIMLGYYREPEKTHAVLKGGWLCTGDVACINSAGFLKIRGRSDDLIIRAGMNVYPAEIEGILKQDARVREALVFGFRDSFGIQLGMKLAGDFSDAGEVRQLCVRLLPPFQIPSKIILTDELPKNVSGKVIRGTLP